MKLLKRKITFKYLDKLDEYKRKGLRSGCLSRQGAGRGLGLELLSRMLWGE